MRELLAPHWYLGSGLAIGGALAFRWGSRCSSCQLLGLFAVAVGCFIVMRGVSRAAQARPPLEGEQAVRRIPGLRRQPRRDVSGVSDLRSYSAVVNAARGGVERQS